MSNDNLHSPCSFQIFRLIWKKGRTAAIGHLFRHKKSERLRQCQSFVSRVDKSNRQFKWNFGGNRRLSIVFYLSRAPFLTRLNRRRQFWEKVLGLSSLICIKTLALSSYFKSANIWSIISAKAVFIIMLLSYHFYSVLFRLCCAFVYSLAILYCISRKLSHNRLI